MSEEHKGAMKDAHKVASTRREPVENRVLLCKAIANSTRLRILDKLADHDCVPSILQKELGIATANLSQHMTVMKAAGIVVRRREGKKVFFSLAMPEVTAVRELIRRIIRRQIRADRRLVVFAETS